MTDIDTQTLNALITKTYAEADAADHLFETSNNRVTVNQARRRFHSLITRAEQLCWLRLALAVAEEPATHIVIDWSGEAWFPMALVDAHGNAVRDLTDNEVELGPTPSDDASWIDFTGPALPAVGCMEYLELAAIRADISIEE